MPGFEFLYYGAGRRFEIGMLMFGNSKFRKWVLSLQKKIWWDRFYNDIDINVSCKFVA